MQPNQSPQSPYPPQPSPGYPPQPGAAPYGAQPYGTPPVGQNYSPMPQQFGAPAQGYPAQPTTPATPPANWYKPPEKEVDTRPASVDEYLGRTTQATPQPQAAAPTQAQPTPPGTVPGQVINGQYAVDYLGGIAPQQSQNAVKIGGKLIDKKLLLFGGGGAIALLLAAALFLFTPKPEAASTLNESSFYGSLLTTSDITKKAGKNIKSSKLRGTNSAFTSLMVGAASEMEQPLSKSGIDPKKLQPSAKKPTKNDQKLIQTLEDARLNATYDRVYTREMQYRLRTMLITLDRIEKINSRQSMQEYVKNTRPKLQSIQKSLEEMKV
ncbi:MAG: hypothetical protein Q4B06_03825 [Candidatus Saccharibacteria bacterium]|nr:hypothetical protein [Candidatus Saccharibacteria bacterium]